MNRRKWLAAVGVGLLICFIGGFVLGSYRQASGYVPTLKVVGDVARVVMLQNPNQMGKLHDISYNGQKYQAMKLVDIIQAAQPIASAQQIYLAGSDGFTAGFTAKDLEDCYIAFTAKNGWEAINLNHPVNSNTKMLQEIVVVSDGSSPDLGLAIINSDKDLIRITPGQLYTRALTDYPYMEGEASIQNGGKTYTSSVHTRRKAFKLADLVALQQGGMVLVMSSDGGCRFVDAQGYLELKDNFINYLLPEEHTQIVNVNGIIIDAPGASITDAYYDARHYLEDNEKVLVAVVDGLTYSRYTSAIAGGHAPFLKKMVPAVKAAGVYPLGSKVWLAAMLTGASPQNDGIVSEKDQDFKTPSILAAALQLKKQALLLHSGPLALKTEAAPVLVGGQDAVGGDDALYAETMNRINQSNSDLLIVCFHDIAVDSERYGNEAGPTLAAITADDKYLEEITARWPGKVIIIGSPGDGVQPNFSCSSLFVPYLRLK